MDAQRNILVVLGISVLPMIVLLMVGCSLSTHGLATVPWDAGYNRYNLLEGLGGWSECTNAALLHRLGLEPYWRLLEQICKKGPTADLLIIAELMPNELASEYWACLLVKEGDDYWCYTTGFPVVLPSEIRKGLAEVPYGVWGKLKDKRTSKAFVELFDREDVWASDSLRVVPYDGEFTGPRAWLIHAYKREGGRFCQMVTDRPMLDTAIIDGRKGIADTRKTGLPDPMATYGNWSTSRGLGEEELADLYESSYPIRLVLNGLLHIIYQEYPKNTSPQ